METLDGGDAGMKVYRRSDEMLRCLECFTSVREILWRHNAPIAPPLQSGEMLAVSRAKKCSRGLKEEKMSWRERQEGESGGGGEAPGCERVSGERKHEA